MKKILLVVLMAVLLTGCGAEEKELTNVGEYEGCKLELQDAKVVQGEDGKQVLKVSAVYTNDNEEPLYAASCFSVRAFQNDAELTDCSDINGAEAELAREVKNGKSLNVSYAFELEDESEVEVLVGTPTADEETIAKGVYLKAETEE